VGDPAVVLSVDTCRDTARDSYVKPGVDAHPLSAANPCEPYSECRVLHIGSFMRELIFAVMRAGRLRYNNQVESALRVLLVAELRCADPVPTHVVLPRDPRAQKVARRVLANPALRLPQTELCQFAGVSVRTLERIFQREVGLDFESWRRQVRLVRAIELLVEGRSVKETAFLVGYQQPGAFVSLFKANFATPRRHGSRR